MQKRPGLRKMLLKKDSPLTQMIRYFGGDFGLATFLKCSLLETEYWNYSPTVMMPFEEIDSIDI